MKNKYKILIITTFTLALFCTTAFIKNLNAQVPIEKTYVVNNVTYKLLNDTLTSDEKLEFNGFVYYKTNFYQ